MSIRLAPMAALAVMRAVAADDIRLATVDPGHFHAALLQKEMLPGISRRVHVYAPLGPDLTAHLNRVARYNLRQQNPTNWEMEVHAAPDFFERMLAERPGNVVVFSGRNRGKIERIGRSVEAGLHVLADKPWIIVAADLPRLEAALNTADNKGVVAWDAMTQRFEITCVLQRELVNDAAIFGERLQGSPDQPTVYMESVHYLFKMVSGTPNLRPAWFFDIREQGEGLTDVGTHLVDLVQWILFPDQAIDHRTEIRMLQGRRWPTPLSEAQLRQVTGEPGGARLDYYCNNSVAYTLRGVHVKLDIKWDFEAAPGTSDTELAIFRGSRASIEVRQGREENYRPEVYVVPVRVEDKAAILAAVRRRGLDAEDLGARLRLVIPDRHRVGHEAHFAMLVEKFLGYVRNPKSLPRWEKPNMLAKYFVTTMGVKLGRGE